MDSKPSQEKQSSSTSIPEKIGKGGLWGTIVGGTTAIASKLAISSVGFSSLGPVSGSIAAAWQSSIGNVAAGSAFSFLQSTGMDGVTPLLYATLGGTGIGVSIALGAFVINPSIRYVSSKYFSKKSNMKPSDNGKWT